MVVLVVMGVCGCGKTTVAGELAARLQCSYRDADEFHTEANKKKMNNGIPLTDQDRIPWLCAVHDYIYSLTQAEQTGVVTCSALKHSYRNILLAGNVLSATSQNGETSKIQAKDVLFVYLMATKAVIQERLQKRVGHFMSPALLDSQLRTLEEPCDPEKYLTVNADNDIATIVNDILDYLSLSKSNAI